MQFENKLRWKVVLSIGMFFVGLTALLIGFYLKMNNGEDNFTTGYLTGTGGGLMAAAGFIALQKLMILKDAAKLRQHRIEDEDERNVLIAYKSSHYSLMITAVGLYIASFFFAFSSEMILASITVVISILILIKFILHFIMRKMV